MNKIKFKNTLNYKKKELKKKINLKKIKKKKQLGI